MSAERFPNLNGLLATSIGRCQWLHWPMFGKEFGMIKYVLRCDDNHKFEAWFSAKADCERLIAAGEIGCPLCERSAIENTPAAHPASLVSRAVRLASARLFPRPTEH